MPPLFRQIPIKELLLKVQQDTGVSTVHTIVNFNKFWSPFKIAPFTVDLLFLRIRNITIRE